MFVTCEAAADFSRDALGFGFETCTTDCIGASVTDLMLAVHAFATAFRIWHKYGSDTGPMGRWVFRSLLVNGVWSTTGVVVWLQPGGRRPYGFDTFYRLNGQCQALLLFCWWSIFATMINGTSARLSEKGLGVLRVFSALHAIVFSARALDSGFEDYVLCGGANVVGPLISMWLLVSWLCYRHGLLSAWFAETKRPAHPMLVAMFSGVAFWVGNSAVLVGCHCGVAKWMRGLLERCMLASGVVSESQLWSGVFEEMATFHLFGLVGNEMLFRAYAWMTEIESLATPAEAPKRKEKKGLADDVISDMFLLQGEPWLDSALSRVTAGAGGKAQ